MSLRIHSKVGDKAKTGDLQKINYPNSVVRASCSLLNTSERDVCPSDTLRVKRSYAVGVREACRRQASRSRSVSPWEKRRLYALQIDWVFKKLDVSRGYFYTNLNRLCGTSIYSRGHGTAMPLPFVALFL
ncbi:hypothetical protein NIES22_29190 [Calothrix brevissima NIES-22]|nr:hypothetical protein NIES22_29190 [Calothrix brevissima NIES-22]